MIPYAREAGALLVLAAICGAAWAGWEWRDRSADLESAEMRADAERKLAEYARAESELQARYRQAERDRVEAVSRAAQEYERGKADAQAKAESVVADLRAGNLRLRQHWQGAVATCDLSRDSAAALAAEREAQLREQGAADLVRLAAEADARIRAIQEAYEAMRRPAPRETQ